MHKGCSLAHSGVSRGRLRHDIKKSLRTKRAKGRSYLYRGTTQLPVGRSFFRLPQTLSGM